MGQHHDSTDIGKLQKQAVLAINTGDYKNAYKYYTAIIEIGMLRKNSLCAAYGNRAYTARKMGDITSALKDCNKAIKVDNSQARAYLERSSCYVDTEQYAVALQDLHRSIELGFKEAKVYNNRGCCFFYLGMYDKAEADFKQAIAQEPDYATPYLHLAHCCMARNDLTEAKTYCRKAIEYNLDNGFAFRERADLRFIEGRYAEALSDYEQFTERHPDKIHGPIMQYITASRLGEDRESLVLGAQIDETENPWWSVIIKTVQGEGTIETALNISGNTKVPLHLSHRALVYLMLLFLQQGRHELAIQIIRTLQGQLNKLSIESLLVESELKRNNIILLRS